MSLEFKTIQPLDYYKKFFAQKVRPDGRGLWKVRPTAINIGSISTADGSALVRLGNTAVICGIKAELAMPKPAEPKKGYLVPNIELSPLCSPHFRPGPPSEQAQVSSQLLLTILNSDLKNLIGVDFSSKCINLEDLCVKEGKLVWVLYCDVFCLNYDGTIVDAAVIALVAALRNLLLPEVTLDAEDGQPKVDLNKLHPINIQASPVSTTLALFEDNIMLIDPTNEEECLASGIVTIVSLEDEKLCGIYKPGGHSLDDVSFQECIAHVHNQARQVRTLINEALQAKPDG